MADTIRVMPEPLTALVHEIVRLTGSDEEECRVVAAHLVGANLSGHDSHGVQMIPTYMRNYERGLLVANAPVDCVRDDGPFLQFDGNKGYGQRVAADVTDAAIERTRKTGVCIATLKNSHHIGRVGTYAETVTAAGMVSIHFTNVTDHHEMVAPHRGAEARFGTNPVTMGVPSADPAAPIILDMATSVVAMGKVRVAHDSGKPVPDSWLIGADGQPTTDPGAMFREPLGALRPFAEHKGYALCLMAELMAGALSGGGTIQPEHERLDGVINTMTMVVIDPQRLGDADWIKREITAMADYSKSAAPADPDEPVLVPGDPERIARAKRGAEGIDIPQGTWTLLMEAAGQVGLDEARAREISGLA